MQTVPHHHLTHRLWEREAALSKLPFLHGESMSRQRSSSGTHRSSRLELLDNKERQHLWQRPDNVHRKNNMEQDEYVPSGRTVDQIFPLKPVLHKRAFSLSNVPKSQHQERLYSCLPTLTDQAAVRHQQRVVRKLEPLHSAHQTGRMKQEREHQDQKQTRLPKEIQMLQQKMFKAEETVRRVQREKTKERSCFQDDRFYSNGYSNWDEERFGYGNGRDDMERWEEWERETVERSRGSARWEGRGRPLTLEMAKGHKLEEKREWDDYGHTAKGNWQREKGMGWGDHAKRRSEMLKLSLEREDEDQCDVRKPNTSESTRRDRSHLKHERRENKEGFHQLTSRFVKEEADGRRTSVEGDPSRRGNRLQRVELSPEENPDAPDQLISCDVCNRCFARDRLPTHMRVCVKKRPQRKIFDMSQYRAKGTELEEFMKTNGRSKTPELKKNNWRQKHESFIQTMRQGRAHEPQTVSNLNPEYVTCPHCGRKFAPGPAERHIPKCQNIKSRPAPPKQPQSSARKRTAL